MAKVEYELVEPDGRFQIGADSDGKEVVIEGGKRFSTDDPVVIRELDGAPHAVQRVKSSTKKED